MNERQKRLNEVYEHLRKFYGIHTQSDFANALRKSRNAITLALNGDEKYLTDKLFKNICEAYKGVFDLNYLLTGEGDLLTVEEDTRNDAIKETFGMIDQSSMVNALIAAKDETIASLRRELDAKNETIALQRSRIADLERQLAAARMSDIDNYPFSIGAAEDNKRPNI
jgi:transcriptional regulator with XRE-family HTH domain